MNLHRDYKLFDLVSLASHEPSEYKALNFLIDAIGCDDSHHKQWYIDQAIRALTGSYYQFIVNVYQGMDENREILYSWDEGIEP